MRKNKRLNAWSKKQLETLTKEYPFAKNTRELAKKIKKPYKAMKSKATILGLYRMVPKSGHSDATAAELKYIKKNYLRLPLKKSHKTSGTVAHIRL